MANPYDDVVASLQPSSDTGGDGNPYDAVVGDIHAERQQRARAVYERALAVNPDQAAEAQRLAKQTGLPADTVERNLAEVKRKEQARLLDLARMAQESPVLARQLADPTFTKQAHDDVDNLANLNRTLAGTAGDIGVTALKGAVGLPQAVVGIADLVTGGYAGKGVEKLGVRFKETQQVLDSLYSPAQQAANKRVDEADGFLPTIAAMLQNPSTIATTVGESVPQMLGGASVGRALVSAAPRIAPWIAAAFGEGTMAAGSAAEQFRQANDDGLIGVRETLASLGAGAGTALFGMVGARAARRMRLDDIDTALVGKGVDEATAGAAKQGFVSAVVKSGISEGVFEELPQSVQEQMWQNWANDRPLGQGVGKAAAQGMLAGFTMGGGFQAVGRIGDHFGSAQEAQDRAGQLQSALQAATNSLLRERNPDEFRRTVQAMAEGTEGAPKEVFVDAEVLNQLPAEVLQALPENVRAQLPDALAANDVVSIPLADVLAVAPGTPLEHALVENARIGDPMAMSQAEAKVAGEQAQQYLSQEAERVIAQAQDAQAMQESRDRVKQGLLDQLNTAGRFRPAVNEAYADWTTAFYTTMAGRLGLSPEEMAARYPLRIGAQAPAAQGAVLDTQTQQPQLAQQDNDYLVAFDKADDTIEITAPQMTEQEVDDAERLFLSAFPKTVTTYRRKTGIARRLRRASDDAANDIGEDPAEPRVVDSPLGPFSGYRTEGVVEAADEFYNPEGALKVKVYGKEQVEAGLMEEPALTFTVMPDGEMSVNGPTPGGETFNEFVARGWAEQSKAGDQVAEGWSNLVNPEGGRLPLNQLVPLLGDVHARVRAWRLEDHVGLHWSRATGASAGLGDYGSAVFFQSVQEPDRRVRLGDLPRDMREELFNEHATNLNPEATERGFYAKSVPSGLLRLAGVQVDKIPASQLARFEGAKLKDIPPIVIADGRLLDGQHRITWAREQGFTSLRYIDVSGLIDTDAGGFISELPKDDTLGQGPRATFNPETLELVLNENADLSSFLHETGHFFLEVMADLASQPDAPAGAQQDMAALMKWFGIKGDENVGGPDAGGELAQGGRHPFADFTREQFLGNPRITPDSNAKDLRPKEITTLKEVSSEPFLGLYTAKFNEDGAAVFFGDKVIASYTFGDTLVVDKKYRRKGIAEELVYQWRMRNPNSRTAASRTKASQALQEKVWRRIASERTLDVYNQDGNLPTDDTQPVRRTPLETWNAMTLDQKRKYHERFAESFEQYLLEGKAPSVELQPLFRKFAAWMKNVYRSLKAFVERHPDGGIVLSDEIRQVFDRMLASDAQIAEAEQVAGLLPEQDATEEAVERLTARSLRDLKWTVNARAKEIKKLQKQAAEMRKGVEAEVRAEVEQQPIYRAMRWLKKGETVDEEGNVVKAEKGFRLDPEALAEMYPETMLARPDLAQLKGMTAKAGLHPDIVADMFGFPSGDALVRSLIDAEPISSVIEGMTDQRMLEEHGDLVDERAIEQAANEAVHNEARAKSLATELKAQAEALNPRTPTGETNAAGRPVTVNALAEAAKQFAANVVARTPLRDLKGRAWQHTAAERRAAKRWQEHTAKGETQEAVKAKQDQMLNHAAAKAAMEAQAEMRKKLEFFRRVVKDGNEKTVDKGRDPDVVNAARAILGAYGVGPAGGKSALEYMELVQKNDPAMYAALQPSMQAALNMAQPIESLTMDELRGLHEEIQGMWHLAKRSRQMEVDGNLMDIEDAEGELQNRMQELGVPDTLPGETGAITPREEFARKLQHAGSLLRRTEQWAEGMGKEFTKLVFQPIKDAADSYRADRVKYRKKYQALIDQVAPHMPKGTIAAPELGYTFGQGHNGIGMAELLHAILHTGNDSNKRKLLLGRKWATENADGTLDTSRWDEFLARLADEGVLKKEHYDFAQGVWDLLEETKPMAQKAHRDVFGRYFAEVTANPVETPFGTYRGGYVPAQADPRIVQDADLRKLAEAENENMAFAFPTTNKGFTKSRTEYNRPLMLDLRTIGQHLDKVLLFSHMEPAARDVNRLLSRKGVAHSLGRIDPTIYSGMLTPWLNRAAKQTVETPVVGDGGIARVLSTLRSRAGMSLMFANVSNTLQQTTGFSTAFAKIKADGLEPHLLRATAQFIAHPKETAKAVAEASPFMENRMENEIAAINEAIDDILLDPSLYQKSQAWFRKHAYFMQTAMANTMEPIVWTAAYNGHLEKNGDEKAAVKYADSVIRQTQGSTLPEDVSRIETGPAYARMFTQFIGYFNMMANTNATALKKIAQETGLKKGAGKALMVATLGMLVPLWVAEAIAVGMRGGPEDEDRDGYLDDWLAAVLGMGTIKGSLAMVPFVGQLANAAINRANKNPADDKMSLSPAVSLLESAVGVPTDVYKALTDPDKLNKRNAVRDVASAVSLATGLPATALARPIGYTAGVEDRRITPTGPADMARGLVTGAASPESR